MSTYIVDKAIAVKFPQANTSYLADVWMLLEEGGDNNCYNVATGRRAKHWACIAVGQSFNVLATVCERAAACPGGSMRLAKAQYTEPEAYIRWWRRAIAKPISMFDLQFMGIRAQLVIDVPTAEAEWHQYTIENAMRGFVREPEIVREWAGDERLRWTVRETNPLELNLWANLATKTAWQKCRVA